MGVQLAGLLRKQQVVVVPIEDSRFSDERSDLARDEMTSERRNKSVVLFGKQTKSRAG